MPEISDSQLRKTYLPIAERLRDNLAFRKKMRADPEKVLREDCKISAPGSQTRKGKSIVRYIRECRTEKTDPTLQGLRNKAMSFIANITGPV